MSLPAQRPRYVPKHEQQGERLEGEELEAYARERNALMLTALTNTFTPEQVATLAARLPHLLNT